MDYVGCSRETLEEGGTLLYNVNTRAGRILSVYIGPCAVYAILPEEADVKLMYPHLRELLGAARVYLYVDRCGAYDPADDTIAGHMDEDTLLETVYDRLYRGQRVYTASGMDHMAAELMRTDALQRGYYRDDSGDLYLLHGNTFRRASKRDPERIFRLCLFGGVFGIHRFAMGRWLSGIVYLLTCGLFLVGWFLDLLQLFMGIQKDKSGALLLPLENKTKKLAALPVGLIISVVALLLYLHSFQYFSLFSPSRGFTDFLNRTLEQLPVDTSAS